MKMFVFLGLLAMFITCALIAQISEISSITYDRLLQSFNDNGHMSIYENRLFINNSTKIIEYIINNDNSLQRVLHHEIYESRGPALIAENKLYLYHGRHYTYEMSIFDLSTTPMSLITIIPMPITYNTCTVMYSHPMEDMIIIQVCDHDILRFNTITNQFETSIIDQGFVAGYDKYIIKAFDNFVDSKHVPIIRFFDSTLIDSDNPLGILVNEFTIELGIPRSGINIKVVGNQLQLCYWGYIGIFDISDIYNPIELVSIHQADNEEWNGFYEALLYEDYMFVMHRDGMRCYDITIPSQPYIIYETSLSPIRNDNSMVVHNDTLYAYEYIHTSVYNLNDNINKEAMFGITAFDTYSFNKDYTSIKPYMQSIPMTITSVFDEKEPVYTIDLNLPPKSLVVGYEIIDDLLYVTIDDLSSSSHFSIYKLNTDEIRFQSELIYRVQLLGRANQMRILNNHIIFATVGNGYNTICEHYIYAFDGSKIDYIDSFYGMLADISGYDPELYFAIKTVNGFEFRDKFDPTEVRFERSLNTSNIADLYHVDKNTISYAVTAGSTITSLIFNTYEDDFTNFVQTHRMNHNSPTFYKGYMSDYVRPNLTSFYAIENGVPRKIGEIDSVQFTTSAWISVEHKMIAVQTSGGRHLYTFEYTPMSDDDKALNNNDITMGLIGNYPNPFNPNTTISFKTTNAGSVVIDVYNIRGQKVSRIFDEYVDKGTHTVHWNGVDDLGREVSSGIYLYQMRTDDFVDTRRMLLMK